MSLDAVTVRRAQHRHHAAAAVAAGAADGLGQHQVAVAQQDAQDDAQQNGLHCHEEQVAQEAQMGTEHGEAVKAHDIKEQRGRLR